MPINTEDLIPATAPTQPAEGTPPPAVNMQDLVPVTTPNAPSDASSPAGAWLLDVLKSGGTGALRGFLTIPGMAGDVYHLGELGLGKLTGSEGMTKEAAEGLGGGSFGSAWLEQKLKDAGVLPTYAPQTEAGRIAYGVGDFAGGSVGLGVGGLAKGALSSGIKAIAKEAIPTLAKEALVGGASGAGSELAQQAVNAASDNPAEISPYLRTGASVAGALAGGGLTGLAHNLATAERPLMADIYKEAGVTPRFASDYNFPHPDLIGTTPTGVAGISRLTDQVIPRMFGAQKYSKASAEDVQQQINRYAMEQFGLGERGADGTFRFSFDPVETFKTAGLDPSSLPPPSRWGATGEYRPTLQQQGTEFQERAQAAITDLRQQTADAYANLAKIVPADTPVDLVNAKAAINDLMTRATSKEGQAILTNPSFQRLAAWGKLDQVTWQDIDAVRQVIGQDIAGAAGSEQSYLRQVYRGLTDDMRGAATKASPQGQEAFEKALNTARTNNELIEDIYSNVADRAAPETIPAWMMGQTKSGASRLETLLQTPAFSPQAETYSNWLLGNLGTTPSSSLGMPGFDYGQLVTKFNQLSPEAQNLLTRQWWSPPGKQGILPTDTGSALENLRLMHEATGTSRGIAAGTPHDVLHDPAALGLGSLGAGIGHLAGGMIPGGAVAGAAAPVAAALGARLTQTWAPGINRFVASQSGENAIGAGTSLGLPAILGTQSGTIANFPNAYQPPPALPTPPATAGTQQHSQWLGNLPKPQAMAFISSRLGPQVGQQLANAQDDQSYGAALMNLSMDPRYRSALS